MVTFTDQPIPTLCILQAFWRSLDSPHAVTTDPSHSYSIASSKYQEDPESQDPPKSDQMLWSGVRTAWTELQVEVMQQFPDTTDSLETRRAVW